MAAKDVATALAQQFLRSGNFVLAGGQARAVRPAVAEAVDLPEYDEYGFSGLAVQSVGVEEGQEVDNPRVHVYVTKGGRLPPREIVHRGEPVTVVVNRIGQVVVRPEAAVSVTHSGAVYLRGGRVACGSSCAPSAEQYAGTLGALVRKVVDEDHNDNSGGPLFLLSNNHVLAAGNHTPVGQPILSPANVDARPGARAPGEVGRHAEIRELRSGDPELVPAACDDVAIAAAVNPDLLSSWQGDDSGYDTPSACVPMETGMAVKKFGRTTGLTVGTVEARLRPFPMPYRCRLFSAVVWFENAWSVLCGRDQDSFALPGDSGSLVVTEDETHAVGIVFAAGGRSARGGGYGIVIPIEHALSMFGGLQLVSGHGL